MEVFFTNTFMPTREEYYEEYRQLAHGRGGALLSAKYLGYDVKLGAAAPGIYGRLFLVTLNVRGALRVVGSEGERNAAKICREDASKLQKPEAASASQ